MSASITIGANNAFFWSDPHWHHGNMAKHRKFSTVEDMNEFLIEKANAKATQDDTLFLLGDVSFAGSAKTIEVLDRIQCKKVLVRGNHDKAMNARVLARFESVHDLLTVKVQIDGTDEVQRIVCCHFPLLAWDMAHYGAWHCHGHSHGSVKYPDPRAKVVDVGVDAWGCCGPIPFEGLRTIMQIRQTITFDHHHPREPK